MVDLVLNRRLNTRNILLAQGTRGEHVGYLMPDGGRRFVQWLGFMERAKARAMKAARPYCLYTDPECFVAGDNITAVNFEVGLKGTWGDRLDLSAALFHTRYDAWHCHSREGGAKRLLAPRRFA